MRQGNSIHGLFIIPSKGLICRVYRDRIAREEKFQQDFFQYLKSTPSKYTARFLISFK